MFSWVGGGGGYYLLQVHLDYVTIGLMIVFQFALHALCII